MQVPGRHDWRPGANSVKDAVGSWAQGDFTAFDTAGRSDSVGSGGIAVPASQGAGGYSTQHRDGCAARSLGYAVPNRRNSFWITRRRRIDFVLN